MQFASEAVGAQRERAARTRAHAERKKSVALGEVPHSFSSDGALRFGDTVVLESQATGGALVNDTWRELQFGTREYLVSASTSLPAAPMARSTFVLKKVDDHLCTWDRGHRRQGYDRDDEKRLHYGQPFQLECNPSLLLDNRTHMLRAPLRLRSERQNTNMKVTSSGNQEVCLSGQNDTNTFWRIVPPECANRHAKGGTTSASSKAMHAVLGQAVPPAAVVAIQHVMTNLPLSVTPSVPVDPDPCLGRVSPEVEVCCLTRSSATTQRAAEPTSVAGPLSSASRPVPARPTSWRFLTASDPAAARDERGLPKRLTRAKDILAKAKEILVLRNQSHYGIREISRSFRIMDDSGDGKLNTEEIKTGLEDYGVFLDDEQLASLFKLFDRDGDGTVSIDEFLVALRGPMSKRRLKLIMMAYACLDKNGDGSVTKAEIGAAYDTSCHPAVINGEMTHDEAIAEFMKQWETEEVDGIISKDEFIKYYRDVSASVDDDDYFELMMRNAWHISGGKGQYANTSNIRCLVVHTDDSAEVVEVKNDLGVRRNDIATITRRLKEQGVKDIKRISLAD